MPTLVETRIQNRWLVQPNHANTLGSAHGGTVLKWMDEAGAMSAMRFANHNCVTARMDQVNFERPIEVGDIAFVDAFVYDAGETSVSVRLRTFSEDPRSGEREATTESYSVYVAIDEDGRPTSVPELTVDTERGRELREAAVDGDDSY